MYSPSLHYPILRQNHQWIVPNHRARIEDNPMATETGTLIRSIKIKLIIITAVIMTPLHRPHAEDPVSIWNEIQ